MNAAVDASPTRLGTALKIALLLAAAAALAGFLYWFFACPCDRVPGGYLLGERAEEPVADWSFVNEVPLCQIQTRIAVLPHSINLNCSALEQELFIGCMDCEGKKWGAALTEQGVARIRIDGVVYPVLARRLTDPAEKDHAWLSSSLKAGRPLDTPRPPDNVWWTFQLTTAL